MSDNDFKNNLKYSRVYKNPDQQDINDKLMSLLDEYQKNNSFENREFLCYLTSAIFLTYKKMYPQLSIYIPFRTKSDMSFMKNISKEFEKFIKDEDKIQNNVSQTSFDPFPVEKDISALRITLDNINFSLPSTPESEALFNDPKIRELMGNDEENENMYSRNKNFEFLNKIENYIQSPIQNGKQYYELKQELLERFIKIIPRQFTDERKPNISFIELYDKTKKDYAYLSENDGFPTTISNSQMTELKDLLNDFRSRIDDPLHFAILRKTLPIILEQPLVKNVLQTSFEYEKESKKPNGFQAIYHTLYTPFGPVEVQAQSNRAYYTCTKGSSYHSGLNGKTIDVKDFFELVDPHDQHDVSYYIDILDSISADRMISPYEIPEFKTKEEKEEFLKTPTGIAYLKSEKYREMMKHIQIKEKLEIIPKNLPKDVYTFDGKIDHEKLQERMDRGEILENPTMIDANEYLFSTALALSPYMNVCSSGHTSYTNASIHHKKIIGEFSEILRKRDSNTCLRDMLIRRLEDLIETPEKFTQDPKVLENINRYLKLVDRHDEIASKLPQNISKKNILSYGEKLRNMERDNPNLDFSI